jgi:hypothetical protein
MQCQPGLFPVAAWKRHDYSMISAHIKLGLSIVSVIDAKGVRHHRHGKKSELRLPKLKLPERKER